MEVIYIGHACILVEGGGSRVLMDPWLEDPTYCNSWFHYPPLVHGIEDLLPVDFVYCSHEHPDHFDPATLRKLPADQKILLPRFTSGVLTERFRKVGLTNFVEMPFGQAVRLGPDLEITCYRSDLVWEDSAVVVESGGTSMFNMNDCKLGDELLARVGQRFEPVIVFVPFSGAIHFPTCYEYDPEQRRALCAARRRKHLEGFVHRAKLLQARRAVPFAGNFALLAEDQLWMNEERDNNINTPDQAIALLAEKAPEIEGLQMNPGDRWSPSGGLTRHFPAPDFARKSEQVRDMATRWKPRLEALRAAEPEARPTLRRDFEAYFRRVADNHPELCTRIGSRIVFDAEGEHGGVWSLHFADGRLRVGDFGDGDPWDMRMTLPAGILQRVLDDEICWDEVCISFRVQFRENPEYFNQDFWAMLYNNSREFLDEYLTNPDPKYS